MAALANFVLTILVMMVIDSTLTSLRVSAEIDLTDILDVVNLDDAQQQNAFQKSYSKKFNKKYKNAAEQQARAANLIQNCKKIQQYNRANKHGIQLKLNHLADYSQQELKAIISPFPPRPQDSSDDDTTGQKRRKRVITTTKATTTLKTTTTAPPTTTLAPAPASQNWTALGYVTPVKYQGSCGNCWAFAATGAMEAALVKSGRPLQNLSEEQYVDCLTYQGGCNGGWDTNAYNWVTVNKKLATEENYSFQMASYDYDPSTIPACKINSVPTFNVNLTKKSVPSRDDATLLKIVGNFGPVSATFNISLTDAGTFFYYSSGIMNASDPDICGNVINHMVLITGYGTDPATGIPYYIVKNSWGTDWGEGGYFRISRNVPAPCGLSIFATLPIIAP